MSNGLPVLNVQGGRGSRRCGSWLGDYCTDEDSSLENEESPLENEDVSTGHRKTPTSRARSCSGARASLYIETEDSPLENADSSTENEDCSTER